MVKEFGSLVLNLLDNGCELAILSDLNLLFAIVLKEFLYDMALMRFHLDLVETNQSFFLKHELWIQEGRNLLGEINSVFNRYFGSLILVFLENKGHGLQIFSVVFNLKFETGSNYIWWILVLAQLW